MEILNLILLFIILILSVVLLYILYYYVRLLKRADLQEKELRKHYLKSARTQASEIVEEAGQEALSLLEASKVVSDKDQKLMENVVKQIIDDQSAYLKISVSKLTQEFDAQLLQLKNNNLQALATVSKEINNTSTAQINEHNKALEQVRENTNKLILELNTQLQQLKNNNINILTNISKDIESNTSSQLGTYVKTLEEETVLSEKAIGKMANEEYKKVEDEIQTYKNEQFKKIDAKVTDLIKKLTAEIFEKSISPEEHKDLIIKTLEKAKTENLLVN